MSRNHENATTSVPPHYPSSKSAAPQKAARLYPILSLLSVILLFLSAGAGIALSAVVLFRNLQSTEVLDPLSRAVFFVASCVSLVYVLAHVLAARTAYIKNYGSPKVYGKYVAGLAFLLARLGLPVWVAAITLAIFVAVNVGLDLSKGVQDNIQWLNVIISIASLFSLGAVLAVIEMADRPFATVGLSQTWFIRGEDPLASPDEDDMEPGLVEVVSIVKEKRDKRQEKHERHDRHDKRPRKTLTKKNPRETEQHRTLRHARSMSMPTPLNTVFSERPSPQMPDSPGFRSAFAWKPPTREGSTPRPTGAPTFDDFGAWRGHMHPSMHHSGSDISTNASAPANDVVLPSMPRQVEYSPRSQALLEQQQKYDLRRWTAIGMQSPPFDGGFLDVPFRRPLTPLMTMEEEHRMLGRRPSTRDGDWEASYHLRMQQDSRPTSSRTSASRTSRSSRSVRASRDEAPSLPPIAGLAARVAENTNSIRPDSDVLPNEGRRRRQTSNMGLSDGRRLTHKMESRVFSQAYRPSSQHQSAAAQEYRTESPTPTVRSDVQNFSRPRTSAAARMQSKVAKRLRAIKMQQEGQSPAQQRTEDQTPPSPSTPGTPGTPRTVRAAAVKTLQERLGRRNQNQPPAEEQRPPSPETPRTARATAVKTLQERLGRRMMRRNEIEEADIQGV